MTVIAIPRCSRLSHYEESVRRAGGEVRALALDTGPASVMRDAQGLLLAGGADVDPALYGEPRHPAFNAAEPGRDAYEIALAREALEAGLPVLAICRGMQVLNVALAGTLIQDITDQVTTTINHSVAEPPTALAHDVRIVPRSRLAGILGGRSDTDACPVNSRHHQAVKAPGTGLIVSATAPDGLIEAIEHPAYRFCIGVQWHPENFYRTGEFSALFDAFVRACSEGNAHRHESG